jgi:hypothetical protein
MGSMNLEVGRQGVGDGSTRPPAHFVWAFNNKAEAVQAASCMRGDGKANEVKVSMRMVKVERARVEMWIVTERRR